MTPFPLRPSVTPLAKAAEANVPGPSTYQSKDHQFLLIRSARKVTDCSTIIGGTPRRRVDIDVSVVESNRFGFNPIRDLTIEHSDTANFSIVTKTIVVVIEKKLNISMDSRYSHATNRIVRHHRNFTCTSCAMSKEEIHPQNRSLLNHLDDLTYFHWCRRILDLDRRRCHSSRNLLPGHS